MSTVPPDMTFAHFKANYRQVNDIKEFASSPSCKRILVVGDLGTGKSSLFTMLHNENKYELLLVNDSNFSVQMIQNFVNHRTIESFFSTKRKLIFIDDVDTILSTKQLLSTVSDLEKVCTVFMTIKTSEERKFTSSCKRLIDRKIHLNKPNDKDCFQIIMHRYVHDESVDQDRVIALIKAQKCNIANVIMLLDQARRPLMSNSDDDASDMCEDETVDTANNDIFHHNIYDIVKDVYTREMSEDHLMRVSNKDHSIICPLVHENLTNLPLSATEYREIYDVLCATDMVDKHIYMNCLWNVNWVMNNYLRFKTINSYTQRTEFKPFDIAFTQQFTKLSSRMNFKKKLAMLPSFVQFCNVIDVLHCMNEMKLQGTWFNDGTESVEDIKTIKEMMTKFSKDFKVE